MKTKPNLQLNPIILKSVIAKLAAKKSQLAGSEKAAIYLAYFNSLNQDEWREVILILAAFNGQIPPSSTWKLNNTSNLIREDELPIYFDKKLDDAYFDTFKLLELISLESRQHFYQVFNQLCLTALDSKELGFIQAIMIWPVFILRGCVSTFVAREIIRKRAIFPIDDPLRFMTDVLIRRAVNWQDKLPHAEYLEIFSEMQKEQYSDNGVMYEFQYLVTIEKYEDAFRCLTKLKKDPMYIMDLEKAIAKVKDWPALWKEISSQLNPEVKRIITKKALKLLNL